MSLVHFLVGRQCERYRLPSLQSVPWFSLQRGRYLPAVYRLIGDRGCRRGTGAPGRRLSGYRDSPDPRAGSIARRVLAPFGHRHHCGYVPFRGDPRWRKVHGGLGSDAVRRDPVPPRAARLEPQTVKMGGSHTARPCQAKTCPRSCRTARSQPVWQKVVFM